MSESFENVLRRIEYKHACLTDEVTRLRADNELLAREVNRLRLERKRLLAERSAAISPAHASSTSPIHNDSSVIDLRAVADDLPSTDRAAGGSATSRTVAAEAEVSVDARLTDDDWERLSGRR